MNPKNYTSSTPVSKSIATIMDLLVEVGAQRIMQNIGPDKQVESIVFDLPVNQPGRPDTMIPFKISANTDEYFKWLVSQRKRQPTDDAKKSLSKQAAMTAWKTLQEWVHIQCDMVHRKQFTVLQAFLPHAYDSVSDTTTYDRVMTGEPVVLRLSE